MAIMESSARNLIGNGTTFKGDIESNGDIRVDGRLIGSVKSNGKISVGQTGVIEGDLNCKQAEIAGVVKGTINTEELTALKSTSKVVVRCRSWLESSILQNAGIGAETPSYAFCNRWKSMVLSRLKDARMAH